MKKVFNLIICMALAISNSFAVAPLKSDTYPTGKGDLKVTLLGHASLQFEYAGKIIYVDPYSAVVDYSKLPKADLILLTHEHPDHLDVPALDAVRTDKTQFVVSKVCHDQLKYGDVITNGGKKQVLGLSIEAVPAYNMLNKRPDGEFYHPKGRGNGYLITFGDLKVYVAGDTENIAEMTHLGKVDIAFLPKNLPYTMNDQMFLDAAAKVKPKYLYPYHFAEFDEGKLSPILKSAGIDVIIRPMKNR